MATDFTKGSFGCPHVASTFEDETNKTSTMETYRKIALWRVQRSQVVPNPAKRRKVSFPTCETCSSTMLRPFVCLGCQFTACWKNEHIKDHLGETGHILCIDVNSGSIYCRICCDFVYHSKAHRVNIAASVAAEERSTFFQEVRTGSREPFKPWTATGKEAAVLDTHLYVPCQARRGLLNLGQTCFMNVILQSFVANPLFRNYFLSDKHNHKLCKTDDCTCCELDIVFSEVYSGTPGPYGPASFLATTWRSTELVGYSQQDAHEFFISTLNQIHSKTRGSTIFQCICVVHSTFSGLLQSDVKCERCGNVTTATDPMLDISLELKDKGGSAVGTELTLFSCLRKYTQPEKLGSNQYSCDKCGKASHEASKRLSIRKLPPVLSFQFKRFEHKSGDKSAAHKIEAPVRFPATINMAPFTTLFMEAKERDSQGNGNADAASFPHLGPEAIYEYDLFCVVCHEGQIDNGHYTCFARSHDEWYRYDDDKVSHSSLGACLGSQAYMCFYVKRRLEYEPYATPSYKKAREAEAIKEKERERAARMREVEDDLLATV
ncbi:cysteine proteinase [Obba rivulosa]|uniref:Ubiquitin carboxyl-terminal hydrolase n=1 Tax=Obba rivulosa TaxID=1052685 RepID=A0A8E2DSA5_9APHY|nr:cysteine proteinase [Obba rivulosa]